MASTFKELFINLRKEVEASYSEINWSRHQKIAEEIALNGKSSTILICIFIAASFAITAFIQEVRISNRNHIIQEQRDVLSVQGIQDSILFNCVHCGWKHTLELEKNEANP